MLRVLDLFSGIGGFSLGLERTGGFQTVAFCEIDPFCRRVLAKHWPEVKQYEDVRTLDAPTLRRDGIAVDVIAGGFPCQDVSSAGKRAGIAGERSGLWSEFARLIGEIRPAYAVVENVSDLRARGFGTVLGDLAAIGYDADWECIPARAVGAPHRRDRIWIVAHPNSGRQQERTQLDGRPTQAAADRNTRRPHVDGLGNALADTDCSRSHARSQARIHRSEESSGPRHEQSERRGWWSTEPNVGRVAHGVPSRVDRLRSLGNAVVPQIPELIGRAILQAHGLKSASGTLNTNGESNEP